jgi:WXG100 family type VII secretion target
MANNISTDTPGMRTARGQFETTSSEFSGHLGSVNTEWRTLQTMWTGTASNGYGKAMDTWEGCFRGILDAMSNMIESLGGSAQMFDAQEEEAAGQAPAWVQELPGF